MNKFSETTGRATKKYLDSTLDKVIQDTNTQVNTKIVEVNAAIAAIPDVNAVATQKAVAMAIVLG